MNNGSQIVLTQGTYSPTINIIPSDGLRFINNLLLNASFEGFGFKPSSLQILLGDFISNLKIGTDKDLVNGVYSFNFQKKELGFQNIYKNLGTVYLFLTTKSIAIKVPDQIFVNYYGCNMVYILNLTHAPFSGLIINYMLDYESFGETFFIDDQLNTYTSVFSHNNTIANLAFCTSADFNLKFKSTIIYLSLTGTNSKSYYLTNTEINVVFKNKTRVNPPFIGSSVINLGRTSVTLNITSNCDGLMFWRIVQKNYNYKNKTTTEILQYMQIHNFTRTINESNSYDIGSYEISDYMIIYNNTRNTTVRPNNTLIINGLEPSKQYEFFGYARNEFRDISSNFTYLRFTTQSFFLSNKIIQLFLFFFI